VTFQHSSCGEPESLSTMLAERVRVKSAVLMYEYGCT